mgnify:CR=1 FL=1
MSTHEQAAPQFSAWVRRSHPLRASLSREMHARKMTPLSAPTQALQFVFLVDQEEARDAAESLARLLAAHDIAFAESDRFMTCRLGALSLSWERHTEFVTYSFISEISDGPLFDLGLFEAVANWIDALPGRIIRSSHISLIAESPTDDAIEDNFAMDDLIISDVAHGRARIWSDFRLHQDGFGRLLIQDKGLEGAETSQLVQRLLELGNYRKMALLGLPTAQAATPTLTALEQRLTVLTARLAEKDADADTALEDLSSLSATLAQIIAETRYRMSATQAYAELCLDRIRRLSVVPVRGYRSLDDFTERRLLPAMRTCDAFTRRLNDLSQRVAWTSALLRTLVDTALARRNRDLLASMDRRTGLQLRLQHTVEGLSVVAVSYYAVGLWHYLKDALDHQGAHIPASVDIAVIPVTILIVWLAIRAIRKVKRR